MSADWKAGDRAVCVEEFSREKILPDGSRIPHIADWPVVGVIYLVDNVEIFFGRPSLNLAGMNCGENAVGYNAKKFRKVVPACDRATQSDSLEIHQGFWDKRPDLK